MITVIVEHHLNEKGRSKFPKWIGSIREKLKAFSGFISLKQLTDIQNEERTLLELKFESLELLRIWAKSPEHDREIEKLLPHRKKKQYSQIFKYEEQ